jgi:hypothetical protein
MASEDDPVVQPVLRDKWAAVAAGVIGLGLLVAAADISPSVPAFTPDQVKDYINALPEEVRNHLSFDELHSLVTEPIRSQLSKILIFVGIGTAFIGVSLFSLNQITHDLFVGIGRRLSDGLPGSGLILILFVTAFSLVAIPIGYHPTSQFFLDLAKVGFGAFLATFIERKQRTPPSESPPPHNS